jgi:hypothetical protein
VRIVTLVLFAAAVLGGPAAVAQSASAPRESTDEQQQAPEEVIVRGRRLSELRIEIEQARRRAYDIFNEINSNDDFDVKCVGESSTGTRMRQQRCRAEFEGRISSRAAQDYMNTLRWVCPEGLTQDCMFSGYSSSGISAAQGVEAELPSKRKQMDDEIVRLANEDDRFAQAILDYYEKHQEYEAERKRRHDN